MPHNAVSGKEEENIRVTPADPKRIALPTRIFLGLAAGATVGVVSNVFWGGSERLAWFTSRVTDTVGQMWLRALIMIVLPLVFASLALGVAGLGDLRKLGRVGVKTLVYFLVVTSLSVVIGLTLVNLIRPGAGLDEATRDRLLQTYAPQVESGKQAAQGLKFDISLLVNIVPRNPLRAMVDFDMLAVIFFALMFGIGLALIPAARAAPMLRFLESLADVVVAIIDVVMKLAPYGVFALIFSVTARFGYDLLVKLGLYVVTVLLGLAIHMFVSYPVLVRMLARMSPVEFFRRIRAIIITAFSTSSSNATLPTTLRVTETGLGVPRSICGFVLPLGATMNMNGTALFEGVTVLFIAQVFGIELSLGAQAVVVLMSVITAIGAAGVPSGAIPLLILVAEAVGVPGGGIALILGVDRLLDMCRTTLNVVGDTTAAAFVARSEGYAFLPGETEEAAAKRNAQKGRRELKDLSPAEFPGVNASVFERYKEAELAWVRTSNLTAIAMIVLLLLTPPLIGGAVGWLIPVVVNIAGVLIFALPHRLRAAALAKQMGIDRRSVFRALEAS
jgi:DAACS family dicarboxylate/amino acid:cation (Na+ or H+) symporter